MAHTFESLREAVIASTIREIAAGNLRVLNNLACGTGKTRTELLLAKTLGVKTVVIFVPRVNLAAQHSKYCENQRLLFMCSDASVSGSEEDLVTLDLRTIANFIRTPSEYQKVIFCTYTSSEKFIELYRNYPDLLTIELAIYDEAHFSSQISEGLFASTLNDWAVKFDNRVFFTASPKNSMLDGEFGKVAYEYSTAQAIADGLIKDYYMVIATINNHQIKTMINETKIAYYAGLAIAAGKAIKECELNSLISFHSTVAGAKKMALAWERIKDKLGLSHIEADFVDGTMSAAEIKNKLTKLAKGNYILTSCQIIGVGVDVPEVDGLIFSDPKESHIAIQQAVGRGQRKNGPDDNDLLPIILPTIVDDKSTVVKFRSLISFLARLRQDPITGAADRPVNQVVAPLISKKPGAISLVGIDNIVDQSFIDAVELELNTLNHRNFDAKEFTARCQEYENFIKNNFAYPSMLAESQEERDLSHWAARQRSWAQSGVLDPKKIEIINEVIGGFVWTVKGVKEGSVQFEKQVSLLRRYIRSNGTFPPEDHALTKWFVRNAKENSVTGGLKVGSVEQLNAFIAEFPDYFKSCRDPINITDTFLKQIGKIKSYYGIHGVLPPATYDKTLDAYVSALHRKITDGQYAKRKEWLIRNFPEFFTAPQGNKDSNGSNKLVYQYTPAEAFKNEHGREPDIFNFEEMKTARHLARKTALKVE